MSKLLAFAVMDAAARAYNRPFFVQSVGVAMRSFEDEVSRVDVNNPMNQHPDDFSLWHIGYYDEDSGELEPLDVLVRLVQARDVLVRGGDGYASAEAQGRAQG